MSGEPQHERGLTEERLALYRRVAAMLGTAQDLEGTLGSAVELCLPALGDFGFLDLVLEEGEVRRTSRAHEDPAIAAILAPTGWVRQAPGPRNLCALSSGELAVHPDIDDAWMVEIAGGPEHLAVLRALAFRSMLTVPIALHGETIGALTLFFGRSGRRHGDDEIALATELAALLAPLLANARLIERQRRTEEALRASEQHLRLALDAGGLGIWDWDVAADRVTWTERLYALHGLPPGSFGGTVADFAALIHPDDRPRIQAQLEATLAGGEPYDIQFRTITPAGEVRWLASRAAVVREEAGRPVRMIGATQDVTARVALLEAERRARDDAEHASRAKDEFLAILGHELRNPLAPIASALELLRLRDDPATARERAILDRQVAHLTRLVDDLLDVARIVRGSVELHREPVAVGEILQRAAETAGPLFTRRQVALEIAPTDADLAVDGDRVRLEQVFTNLLTNAARYTDADGTVSVTARRDGDRVEIAVRDTGVGIAPELLPRIFELFVQGPRPLDRASGGLGLGLAIVHNLVTLHGGQVEASSDGVGRGATMTVRLPAATAAVATPEGAADARPARARLLLVDDNRDAADLLGELLGRAGFEVDVAYDGPGALDRVAAAVPDVAVLDIGLPGMDGYELAAALRADPRSAAIRMVALTGYGSAADQAKVKDAGFVAHLIKPVTLKAITRVVEELLGREAA